MSDFRTTYNLKTNHLVLAVDLDGTFLRFQNKSTDPLYELILSNRDKITLIYATGRATESVLPIMANPIIPSPDYIIGDVGATIVDKNLNHVTEVQSQIDEKWQGSLAISKKLAQFKELKRQSVPQEGRCSYFVEGKESVDVKKIKNALGDFDCEVLISDNKYLDILPKGVSKGSTLEKFMRFKGWTPSQVVVAGDTMNDYSMFCIGCNGVAVSGAEKELVDKIKKIKKCHVAKEEGTRGILEALESFRLVEKSAEQKDHEITGKSEFVVVYHRQPFDEVRSGKKIIRKLPESPNGIIPTLLGCFSSDVLGSWVAWSKEIPSHGDFETHVKVDPEKYPGLTAARIPLSNEDVSIFYKKFSKEAFWPIIFSFPEKVILNHDHWLHFKKINKLFAEQTSREAKKNAVVWIHDYNLWLVPGYLRRLRPDLKISFFHHTTFPSSDIFNILPWKEEIIASLTQCDHVGFHIPRYAENFVDVARSSFPVKTLQRKECAPQFMTYGCALGIDQYSSLIEVENRKISIGVHPVGVDLNRIQKAFKQPHSQEIYKNLEKEFAGKRLILSVERLDYVKGPLEKVEAFEKLLERHPEYHGKIVLINIVTPPAPGMDIYKTTREKLDQIVGRVNGRFSKLNWTPIKYFYKSFPFEDLLAFYALSDIAWITPLRDGLNLVCKEYIAVKDIAKKKGVLVLSEFAGASTELHGALLANPFDKEDMVKVLYDALNLDDREMTSRQKRLTAIVKSNDIVRWREGYLKHLELL